MKQVSAKAYARAGLLGNPSDGYHGKTISFAFKNFCAEVQLTESVAIEFDDENRFANLRVFANEVDFREADGGTRLLKAALARWLRHFPECLERAQPNFQLTFKTNIPRQVGLAGSSAIVIASLRAFSTWFDWPIEPALMASLALAAESDLGISAGLQDRVAQSMQGLVFMDFGAEKMYCVNELVIGQYVPMDLGLLQNVYVAYANNIPESTQVLHGDLRKRYHSGDAKVVEAIGAVAELAEAGKIALQAGDHAKLSELIDRNFDLRQSICVLNPGHVQMIDVARQCGVSAKYCGSGGAIVGTFSQPSDFERLKQRMCEIDCVAIRPTII